MVTRKKNNKIIFYNVFHSGDSIVSTSNKIEIVKEGLEYLRAWLNLATDSCYCSTESLIVFEQSLFASCTLARELHPQEALITIYECAKVVLKFFHNI